jgi:tetratricopeptide (TPR) repeat protein
MLVTQTPNDVTGAVPLFERAIARDPAFAAAHAWLAICQSFGRDYVGGPLASDRPLARMYAERAIALDPNNADALWALGYVDAHDGNLDKGIAGFEAALQVNPNQADALALLGELLVYAGRGDEAVDRLKLAFRLNPYPPSYYTWLLGFSLYAARRYDEALTSMARNLPDDAVWMRIFAAALFRLGRIDEAHTAAKRYILAHPDFTVSHWSSTQPFRHTDEKAHFAQAFLAMGLPA